MKLNKEICSKELPIYDAHYAIGVFKTKKLRYRQLSLMKQENIRVMGLKEETLLQSLKYVLGKWCGYCFKYKPTGCSSCPITKKLGKRCSESDYFKGARFAKTKTEFLKYHKKWCKEIGLWQKSWR